MPVYSLACFFCGKTLWHTCNIKLLKEHKLCKDWDCTVIEVIVIALKKLAQRWEGHQWVRVLTKAQPETQVSEVPEGACAAASVQEARIRTVDVMQHACIDHDNSPETCQTGLALCSQQILAVGQGAVVHCPPTS